MYILNKHILNELNSLVLFVILNMRNILTVLKILAKIFNNVIFR